MPKIIRKLPNEPFEVLEVNEKYGHELNRYIGCDLLDFIYMDQEHRLFLIVDDIGALKESEANFKIRLASPSSYPIVILYGTVIMFRKDDEQLVDITEEDIHRFQELLVDDMFLHTPIY